MKQFTFNTQFYGFTTPSSFVVVAENLHEATLKAHALLDQMSLLRLITVPEDVVLVKRWN